MVVPAALVIQWRDTYLQLQPPPKVLVYKEQEEVTHTHMREYDVVITSYSHLVREFGKMTTVRANYKALWRNPREKTREVLQKNGKIKVVKIDGEWAKYSLLVTDWGRICFEEGHCLRNQETSAFKAAVNLQGLKKIILTGTPFANDYTDIQAYFKLLNIYPLHDDIFFVSHFTRPIRNAKNARVETPTLVGIRGGILYTAFQSVIIRRRKRGVFEGSLLTSLIAPRVEDIWVTLDDTGSNPCIFGSQEEYTSVLDDMDETGKARIGDFFAWHRGEGNDECLAKKVLTIHNNPIAVCERDLRYDSRRQWSNALRVRATEDRSLK